MPTRFLPRRPLRKRLAPRTPKVQKTSGNECYHNPPSSYHEGDQYVSAHDRNCAFSRYNLTKCTKDNCEPSDVLGKCSTACHACGPACSRLGCRKGMQSSGRGSPLRRRRMLRKRCPGPQQDYGPDEGQFAMTPVQSNSSHYSPASGMLEPPAEPQGILSIKNVSEIHITSIRSVSDDDSPIETHSHHTIEYEESFNDDEDFDNEEDENENWMDENNNNIGYNDNEVFVNNNVFEDPDNQMHDDGGFNQEFNNDFNDDYNQQQGNEGEEEESSECECDPECENSCNPNYDPPLHTSSPPPGGSVAEMGTQYDNFDDEDDCGKCDASCQNSCNIDFYQSKQSVGNSPIESPPRSMHSAGTSMGGQSTPPCDDYSCLEAPSLKFSRSQAPSVNSTGSKLQFAEPVLIEQATEVFDTSDQLAERVGPDGLPRYQYVIETQTDIYSNLDAQSARSMGSTGFHETQAQPQMNPAPGPFHEDQSDYLQRKTPPQVQFQDDNQSRTSTQSLYRENKASTLRSIVGADRRSEAEAFDSQSTSIVKSLTSTHKLLSQPMSSSSLLESLDQDVQKELFEEIPLPPPDPYTEYEQDMLDQLGEEEGEGEDQFEYSNFKMDYDGNELDEQFEPIGAEEEVYDEDFEDQPDPDIDQFPNRSSQIVGTPRMQSVGSVGSAASLPGQPPSTRISSPSTDVQHTVNDAGIQCEGIGPPPVNMRDVMIQDETVDEGPCYCMDPENDPALRFSKGTSPIPVGSNCICHIKIGPGSPKKNTKMKSKFRTAPSRHKPIWRHGMRDEPRLMGRGSNLHRLGKYNPNSE